MYDFFRHENHRFPAALSDDGKLHACQCQKSQLAAVLESHVTLPDNDWRNFLGDNGNKTDLFNFLADKIEQMPSPNMAIVTKEENALSNHMISLEGVSPCSHEEADIQIFVHARHAAQEGSKSLLVKASDTDILVIASALCQTFRR